MKLKLNGIEVEGNESDLKKLLFAPEKGVQEEKDNQKQAVEERESWTSALQPASLARTAKKASKKHKHKYQRKGYDVLSQRMKNIQARAKEIKLSVSGMSHAEALKQAFEESKTVPKKADEVLKAVKGHFCRICGKKLRGRRRALCSNKVCHNKENVRSVIKHRLLYGQKTPYNKEEHEQRRVFIQSKAKYLSKTQSMDYEKALRVASLAWESNHLKQEKIHELNPQLRLIKSLISGEIPDITPLQVAMIDPNMKFEDFAVWVATNQQNIKAKLFIKDGYFVITKTEITFRKDRRG